MLHVGDIGVRTVCILPFLLCVDGKTDTGVYTYWFLPCLLRVNEAGVCLDLPQTRGGF